MSTRCECRVLKLSREMGQAKQSLDPFSRQRDQRSKFSLPLSSPAGVVAVAAIASVSIMPVASVAIKGERPIAPVSVIAGTPIATVKADMPVTAINADVPIAAVYAVPTVSPANEYVFDERRTVLLDALAEWGGWNGLATSRGASDQSRSERCYYEACSHCLFPTYALFGVPPV